MKKKAVKSVICMILMMALLVSLAVPVSADKLRVTLGDVNESGITTVMDATLIQRHLARVSDEYFPQITSSGDVDRNSKLESIDATYIMRYCAGESIPYQIGGLVAYNGVDPFSGENNIQLKVWAPETACELTRQMCKDFIARYPDKSISIMVQEAEEGNIVGSYVNDPNSAADVFSMSCDQIELLKRKNALSPPTDAEAKAVKARDTAFSVKASSVNGKLMTFPETGESGYYLVYDKRVVSNQDARTLEGVLKACRRANKKFIVDAGNAFYSTMFAFTGGLKLEGISSDQVQQFNNYNEEQVVDALEAFATLFHQYNDVVASNSVDYIGYGMVVGDVGAGIDGTWNASVLKNNLGSNYGAAKLPTINIKGVNTQIYSLCGCKTLGINSRTRYPKAAHALANFLTNEKSQMLRTEQLGWSPSNKEVIDSGALKDNPGAAACLEQSEYSVPMSGIAGTFWTPMGSLGNYLIMSNTVSRTAIRNKFRQTINEIKDE